jgi:hypothetical protein
VEDDVKNDDDNVCHDLTSQLVVLHERGQDWCCACVLKEYVRHARLC